MFFDTNALHKASFSQSLRNDYNRSMAARITLNTAISSIVSNKRRASALKSLGVVTVKDALTYYPFRVTNPLKRTHLSQILPGQEVAFCAIIQSINLVQMNARRGYRLDINVSQDASRAQIVYFSKASNTLNGLAAA